MSRERSYYADILNFSTLHYNELTDLLMCIFNSFIFDKYSVQIQHILFILFGIIKLYYICI